MEAKLLNSTCKSCKYPRFTCKAHPVRIGLMLAFSPSSAEKISSENTSFFSLQGGLILFLLSREMLYLCDFKGQMNTRKLMLCQWWSPAWRSVPTSEPLAGKMCLIPTCFKLSRIIPVHHPWTIYLTPAVTKTGSAGFRQQVRLRNLSLSKMISNTSVFPSAFPAALHHTH